MEPPQMQRLRSAITMPSIYKPLVYIFLANAIAPSFNQMMYVRPLPTLTAPLVCNWGGGWRQSLLAPAPGASVGGSRNKRVPNT